MKPLTDKQRVALLAAESPAGLSPWDAGASTIAWLKQRVLVVRAPRPGGSYVYVITANGREALAQGGVP